MAGSAIERLQHLLAEQRQALVANDLDALTATNGELEALLATLREQPAGRDRAVRSLRLALQQHAELIGRAHAANHRALAVLMPPAPTYGGNAQLMSTGRRLTA